MPDNMPTRPERLFLAGCTKEQVQNHFSATVLNQVKESTYREHTRKSVMGQRPIWGVEDGPVLRTTWEQVQPGDWILFYTGENPIRVPRNGILEYAAKVVNTEENLDLHDQLWEEYEGSGGLSGNDRGPWPLILYLEDLVNTEVHYNELRDTFADFSENWNPQRFSTYSGETNIRRKYGSISDFIDAEAI